MRNRSQARKLLLAFTMVAPLAAVGFGGTAAAAANDGANGKDDATIYTMTNDPAGNEILAISDNGGRLEYTGEYSTGGEGSGAGLGSQGSIVVSGNNLLAVNAGSDEVSLFSVKNDGSLRLRDVESSGGDQPVSVTVHRNRVYVVNAGDSSVSGFKIRGNDLSPIANSTRSLPGAGPAQISFDNTGQRLVVTQKATSTIDVLPVSRRGVAGAAVSNASTGETPFGFSINSDNALIVSNAAGGAAGDASASSYRFDGKSTDLIPISATVANTQSASCWIALSGDEQHAFSANTGSGTISSFSVGSGGELKLDNAVAATTGAGPIDMVEVSGTLFTLNSGSSTLSAHAIGSGGELKDSGGIKVPPGANGLATS